MRQGVWVLLCLSAVSAAANLEALYDARDWFRLREAVERQTASPFYRGAVAAAFNDTAAAERELNAVIARRQKKAADAHLLLADMYMREGVYTKALAHIQAVRKTAPQRTGNDDMFDVAANWPDQTLAEAKPSSVPLPLQPVGVTVPVEVNGQKVTWIFDTGANWSLVSESEAKLLGMEVRDTTTKVTDATGRGVPMRIGNVREFRIGGYVLRNVRFFVMTDDRQPFVDLRPGARGVIGMPVMVALGRMSWEFNGYMQLGGEKLAGKPNLAFDGSMPILQIEARGKQVPVVFDTGADKTHFWPRFAKEMTSGKERATQVTTSYSGMGHTVEIASFNLPELSMLIGGGKINMRPATVLLNQEGDGAKFYYANLGADALIRGNRVTMDLRSMRLQLD